MEQNKWIIFDLDGTLALIDKRRKVSEQQSPDRYNKKKNN